MLLKSHAGGKEKLWRSCAEEHFVFCEEVCVSTLLGVVPGQVSFLPLV